MLRLARLLPRQSNISRGRKEKKNCRHVQDDKGVCICFSNTLFRQTFPRPHAFTSAHVFYPHRRGQSGSHGVIQVLAAA